jgi:S-(hydroxymethyl)mycothiol dehydrogenase
MAMRAQGVVAREMNKPAQLEEILIDPPGPGEVLVRILASGVCHTDLHVVHGIAPDGFPFLLGHEGAGVIAQVGPGVDESRVGEHVMLAWRAPCGHCRFCLIGQPQLCADSLNAGPRLHTAGGQTLTPVLGIGTFCTHTVVAAAQAITAPADLSPVPLSLIGCGVATGVCAALNSASVRRGSTVAVFGCGAVGVNVIQGARIADARVIIGVDIEPRKLEWAKGFGATHVVDAREGDPVARIKELTGGYGVDYSFEAIGLPQTFLQAVFSRDLAGTHVQLGVFPRDAVAEFPLAQFFDRGGAIRVGWYGDTLPTRDFPMLADWYRTGRLKLDELVTERIGLGDVEHAFARMQRGETLRSVIDLSR